jgi:hypothetical protein
MLMSQSGVRRICCCDGSLQRLGIGRVLVVVLKFGIVKLSTKSPDPHGLGTI